jgi:hypothetical protein
MSEGGGGGRRQPSSPSPPPRRRHDDDDGDGAAAVPRHAAATTGDDDDDEHLHVHERHNASSPTIMQELEEGTDPFQESVIRFHLAMTEVMQHTHTQAGGGGGGGGKKQSEDDEARLHAAWQSIYEELGAMRAEIYVGSAAADNTEAQRAVQEEMLADCERKAGEIMLNLLRKATSAMSPDPEAAPGIFLECVRLRQEAKAANIYGGFLQRRLTEATDEALRVVDSVRSLRRLQLGSSNSTAEDADTEALDQDSQPHVTGLNRVLGEASRVIGSLRGDEYYYEEEGEGGGGGREGGRRLPWVSETILTRLCKALNEIALRQAVKLLQWYTEDCSVRKWQEKCLERSEDIVIQVGR